MALQGNARHNLPRLERAMELYPKERMAATVRAMNRTLTTVRAEGARSMAEVYPGLKIGTIKRQMKQERATSRSPRAVLTFSNKRFGLFGNWPVSKILTATGVSVRLRGVSGRGGVRLGRMPFAIETWDGTRIPRSALVNAFIQRARSSGVVNVYVRIGQARYPISGLVAPSLSSAFTERRIGAALIARGRVRFAQALAQETKFRLSQRSV